MIYEYRAVDRADLTQEFEFPMGQAPHEFTDDEGTFWRRMYTTQEPVFYGPGFYSTDNSKSALKRIPRKERI